MIYLFHRKDMFYPLELKDDADAVANAKCNPGTTKVERVVYDDGLNETSQVEVVWKDGE